MRIPHNKYLGSNVDQNGSDNAQRNQPDVHSQSGLPIVEGTKLGTPKIIIIPTQGRKFNFSKDQSLLVF